MIKYEEHGKWSKTASWLFIIFLSATLITWAMSLMFLIKAVPREWDYGNLEFTPAKSIYSTNYPVGEASGNMITPLPEGVSMEEANK